MSATRFALGDRVSMTGTVAKARSYYGEITYEEQAVPFRYSTWDGSLTTPYTSGVIVGKRHVSDGVADNDEWGFIPKKGTSRAVWLIAFDLRRNPVMCLGHQVEPVAA